MGGLRGHTPTAREGSFPVKGRIPPVDLSEDFRWHLQWKWGRPDRDSAHSDPGDHAWVDHGAAEAKRVAEIGHHPACLGSLEDARSRE